MTTPEKPPPDLNLDTIERELDYAAIHGDVDYLSLLVRAPITRVRELEAENATLKETAERHVNELDARVDELEAENKRLKR